MFVVENSHHLYTLRLERENDWVFQGMWLCGWFWKAGINYDHFFAHGLSEIKANHLHSPFFTTCWLVFWVSNARDTGKVCCLNVCYNELSICQALPPQHFIRLINLRVFVPYRQFVYASDCQFVACYTTFILADEQSKAIFW